MDELAKVARGIDIAEAEWKDKSKTAVMRAIGGVLDEQNGEDEKKTMIMKMLPYAPDRVSKMIMKVILKQDSTGSGGTSPSSDRRDSIADTVSILQGMGIDAGTQEHLKKEFKINGVIGSNTKENLNYISICSQVADGKKKKYKDEEIAMAIRRAVAPASSLRTYLDSKTDMTLKEMMLFIRSAMKEKSSTEIFQELNNACQADAEDAQKFVLRAMDLRERVTMASKAEGAISYNEDLVQSMFLHSIRTGLQDDAVKSRLESFLGKDAKTPDNILIQELNQIASEETERKIKMKDHRSTDQKVKIAEVTATSNDKLLETVQQMSQQMLTLQKDLDAMKNNRQFAPRNRFAPRRGCNFCTKEGNEGNCRHCFRCGAGDHRISNCPKPPSNC